MFIIERREKKESVTNLKKMMPLYGTNSEHYNSHSKISGGLCSILVLIRSYWSRHRINVGIGWSLGQSLWSYESLFNDKVVNNRTNW